MELESANPQDIKDSIARIIRYIGDDSSREGLVDTPSRVVKSWKELYRGYGQSPEEVLGTVFSEGACDEMVILKDIEFYSMCEHHMLPFFGKAYIGYIPDGRVVGISKIARLVDVYARRLQIQERMAAEIADAIMRFLKPQGAIVLLKAQHMCMLSRGIQKQNSVMVTSAIRGNLEQSTSRSEFFSAINI